MRGVSVDEISGVDLADEVLFQDFVDVLVSMDGKDVPVGLDAATHGTQDNVAAGMVWHPVGNVVDAVAAVHPVALGVTIVTVDLVESEESTLGIFIVFDIVASRWRFGERVAAELSQSEASC